MSWWEHIRCALCEHRLPSRERSFPCAFLSFTNDFIINDNDFKLVKYAEEMAIFGLLQKTDSLGEAADFETWCHTSRLVINVAKTAELSCDRTSPGRPLTLLI